MLTKIEIQLFEKGKKKQSIQMLEKLNFYVMCGKLSHVYNIYFWILVSATKFRILEEINQFEMCNNPSEFEIFNNLIFTIEFSCTRKDHSSAFPLCAGIIFHSSRVSIREGVGRCKKGDQQLLYWLKLLSEYLRCLYLYWIHHKPQDILSLDPVKFFHTTTVGKENC